MSHTILDTGFYSSKQNRSPQGVYILVRGDRQNILISISNKCYKRNKLG